MGAGGLTSGTKVLHDRSTEEGPAKGVKQAVHREKMQNPRLGFGCLRHGYRQEGSGATWLGAVCIGDGWLVALLRTLRLSGRDLCGRDGSVQFRRARRQSR